MIFWRFRLKAALHLRSAEFLPFLKLGLLDDRGFLPFAEQYSEKLSLPTILLEDVNWGCLAEGYGDRQKDHVYHLMSISRQTPAYPVLQQKAGDLCR